MTTLSPQTARRFAVRAGDFVQVFAGDLWLTFEARDIVLRAGERFVAPRDGEIMAQSLGGAARFRLMSAEQTSQTARRFEQRIFGRVRFWRAVHPLGRYGSGS